MLALVLTAPLPSSRDRYMTELVPPSGGRKVIPPLVSELLITDGAWHRIGLVWDGTYRRLYVDGVEDTQAGIALSSLKSVRGGLLFGAAESLAPGTFWTGLIDDVRIYNRAVTP